MKFDDYLDALGNGTDLTSDQSSHFLGLMMDNMSLSDDQLKQALTLITEKKPSADEICGFVMAMKARMRVIKAPKNAVDTCGTGGDRSGSFNISTASALLVSAGGLSVAKHGNRAATSKCGSADVLEALHIPIDLSPSLAENAISSHHFVFLFAPLYHPALKRLAIVRKQLPFPTVFNLLGPLLNPAGVKYQVIGTYNQANAKVLADVLNKLKLSKRALVLWSEDGLDEAGLDAPVHITEIRNSEVSSYTIKAEEFGLQPAPLSALKGGDASENARLISEAFKPNETYSEVQRCIILNSALVFYVAGRTHSITEGITYAKSVLQSGQAAQHLKDLQIDE